MARQRQVSINTAHEDFGLVAGQNTPGGSSGRIGLVDTRTLGKPEPFEGTPEGFADRVLCSAHI